MNQLNKVVCYCSLLIVTFLMACNPSRKINKDYLYFQNNKENLGSVHFKELTIQPNDLLNILIFSKSLNQDQAALFNIPGEQGYLVGLDGNIEMPIIGRIAAAGLTRTQLQDTLQKRLLPYVKDPAAVVRFRQFKVNVLGEVHSPGIQSFPTDRVTIIDAISASGDLTESGQRKNVTVIREEKNGSRKMYEVDLRSASLFQSPGYQLQQNDIVYVSANNKKLKSLKDRKESFRTVQVIASLISVASTLVFLFNR